MFVGELLTRVLTERPNMGVRAFREVKTGLQQGWQALQPIINRYTVAECAYMVGLSQMDFEIRPGADAQISRW